MQRLPSRGKADRPLPLQTKSFHRFSPNSSPTTPTSRSRSNTLPGPLPSSLQTPSDVSKPTDREPDPFDHDEAAIGPPFSEQEPGSPFPEGYDELPAEIQTLLERFLESLSAKTHPAPLSIDRLSELFQEFYIIAEAHIADHITNLSITPSKRNGGQSPAPSVSSIASRSSKGIGKTKSANPGDGTQQMLTPAEIADRRRGRKQLELKRAALEEAVERSVCEKLYPRIWRHRTTDDDERDEKVRSRAAALSVVGVGLEELLSTAMASDQVAQDALKDVTEDGDHAKELLSSARNSLALMNKERFPLGKLTHLKATHKNIVETLSNLFPSSSSADEILPTLIYTIITSEPESIHVISNLNFIERFRGTNKVDGETAYCMTNFEAAISFLETVDLSSIRPDEMSNGLSRYTSHPSTPVHERPDPLYRGLPGQSDGGLAQPSPIRARSRRLSSLIQSRPKPFEINTDQMMAGAEDALETIHSALDGSFKFLFGRLREKQAHATPDGSPDVRLPKTLEDARKLVSTPPPLGDDDIAAGADTTAADSPEGSKSDKPEDGSTTLATPHARRGSLRDQSVDSTQSASSAKRVAFVERRPSTQAAKSRGDSPKAVVSNAIASAQTPLGYNAVESMRSLGNTLNPLKSFGGMGMMRGFGRTVSSGGASPAAASSSAAAAAAAAAASGGPLNEKTAMPLSGVAPPIRRFVDLKEPKELTLFEVELLLRDYQRLAGALREAGGLEAV